MFKKKEVNVSMEKCWYRYSDLDEVNYNENQLWEKVLVTYNKHKNNSVKKCENQIKTNWNWSAKDKITYKKNKK